MCWGTSMRLLGQRPRYQEGPPRGPVPCVAPVGGVDFNRTQAPPPTSGGGHSDLSPKAAHQRNTRRMNAGSLEALRVARPEAVVSRGNERASHSDRFLWRRVLRTDLEGLPDGSTEARNGCDGLPTGWVRGLKPRIGRGVAETILRLFIFLRSRGPIPRAGLVSRS